MFFWFGVLLNEAGGYKNGLGYFSNQNPSVLQQEQSLPIICDPKAIVLAGGKSKVELFPKCGVGNTCCYWQTRKNMS